MTSKAEKSPPRFIDAYAGAGAGLVGTLIGYPLDVLKGRLQATAGEVSMGSAMRSIYQCDGIRGFYRGVFPPIISLTMLNTINFSNYALFTKALNIEHPVQGFNPLVFVAGAAVGPTAAFISTPFEFLKIQLQFSQKNNMKFKNTADAARQIFHSHGLQALYTGHSINTYREMLFLGTYFSCYEHTKQVLSSVLGVGMAVPTAGGIAGAVGWLVSFPLDAIKTNIQNVRLRDHGIDSKTLSIRDAVLTQFRKKGFFSMYRGVAPSILRAFVVSSSRFSVYESIMWVLSS